MVNTSQDKPQDWASSILYGLFFALIGLQYLIGGLNVISLHLASILAVWIVIRDKMLGRLFQKSSFWEIWLVGFSYCYFFYFLVHYAVFPAGSKQFPQENYLWLFVPFLLYALQDFDFERFFLLCARIAPIAILLLLLATIAEYVLHDGRRVMWISRNTLTLSALVTTGVHLAFIAWHDVNRKTQLLLIASWVVGLYIIAVLSQSRAASFAYLLCAGLTLIYILYQPNLSFMKNLRRMILPLTICAALLCTALGIIIHFELSHGIVKLYHAITTQDLQADGSASLRWEAWSHAWTYKGEVPFWGIGGEEAIKPFLSQFGDGLLLTQLHNDFLNHFYAGGVIGLFLASGLILMLPAMLVFAKGKSVRFVYLALVTELAILSLSVPNRVLWSVVRIDWLLVMLVFLVLLWKSDRRVVELNPNS